MLILSTKEKTMSETYDAKISITIHAPVAKVWQALTRPELIKHYMHGTNTSSDWKVGSPITWTGEWKGKPYQDKGVILAIEPSKLLKYTHWSPMGGSEDKPENYHTVTYTLTEQGKDTTLSLTQSNNPTQAAADEMAKNNWRPVLEGLKELVEKG
jgi:uncharacterized protein YndB with AHSA1/START domain